MKKCSYCLKEKEEIEFFKKRKNTLEGYCKDCKREKLKKLVEKDPEKYREKERLRSEKRRQTQEWKEWRKDHQKRNRDNINEKARDLYSRSLSVREKAVNWRKNNRDKVNKSIREHAKRNPFKVAARLFANKAIKGGILVRPDSCNECMRIIKVEAHHEDYLMPLNVEWLCRSCHGRRHRKMK